MPLNIREGLSLDDVLLEPQHSTIKSRRNVDTTINLSKGLFTKHGIIPAPMKTVSDFDMVSAAYNYGAISILHRFTTWDEQISLCKKVSELSNGFNWIGFSVGVKKEDYSKVDYLVSQGIKILNIDVANGHSELCIDMTKYIAKTYPDVFVIAGNVANGIGAKLLWEVGADAVRAGIGCGGLCTTRLQTGNGVPLITNLSEMYDVKIKLTEKTDAYGKQRTAVINKSIFIIADGGCKNAGDLVKCFCFADLIFSGSLFAGSLEAPGQIVEINGDQYKSYEGSSTYQNTNVEGVKALVKCKGNYSEIVDKLLEGIRSGMSYQNANNMKELKECPQFVKITNNGLIESKPHINGIIKG